MDEGEKRRVAERQDQPAGEFSAWLRLARRTQKLKTVGADVPCGQCTACCRSFYFVHIRPDEAETLARIPRRLLFPAPGLPRGNVLMGYNEKGECPMFVDNRCSIYQARPQTCRDYDCRILSATGIALGEDGPQALIARQVQRWKFDFPGEVDRQEHSAVQAAAAFLRDCRASFPETLPTNPAELAALALEVYELFLATQRASAGESPSEADVARAVREAGASRT